MSSGPLLLPLIARALHIGLWGLQTGLVASAWSIVLLMGYMWRLADPTFRRQWELEEQRHGRGASLAQQLASARRAHTSWRQIR
jgi:hypothetical protein